jgi:deoxyuridine 5'-triphosphate nucleotidohydrolase
MENLNEDYFNVIDTPIKAYMLGLIIYNVKHSDSSRNNLTIEIPVDENIKNIKFNSYFRSIDKIKKELNKIGECVYNHNNNSIMLKITSDHVISDIYKSLNVKSLSVCDLDIAYLINSIKDPHIYNQFVKAYIEKYGNIAHENNDSVLHITFYIDKNHETVTKLYSIPYNTNKLFNLTISAYTNVNLIDLLGLLYIDDKIPFINLKLYESFHKILNNSNDITLPQIKVFRHDENAILPSKTRVSDAGYDITIIKEAKKLTDNTTLYDTGIKLDIPNGYYVEIVPRSSISKSGYILANSVGIIDQSYRGNILVALTKTCPTAADIELPFRCCQMIIRKQIYGKIIECPEDFNETSRNEGGFGSTN